jgi:hypothetical protein
MEDGRGMMEESETYTSSFVRADRSSLIHLFFFAPLRLCARNVVVRAYEINNYPKIAQDFGPDTRCFE